MAKSSDEHSEGKRDHWFSNTEVTGEIIKGPGLGWVEVRREWRNIRSTLEKGSLAENLKMEWYLLLCVYQCVCLKQLPRVIISCGQSDKLP